MATNTTTTTCATCWTACVAIRVPAESDRTLAEAATRRLSTADKIDRVQIDEIAGLKPTLSATVVTVAVSLQTTTSCSRTVLESALETVSGLEQIQTAAPATD
jgi:hypothetical protein